MIFSLQATVLPATTAATLAAPGGLTVANKNSSTPILSWKKVKKAAGYEVQVDNDPAFASPSSRPSRPTTAGPHDRPPPRPGLLARARGAGERPRPGPRHVHREAGRRPLPRQSPADGSASPQPSSPPLLSWVGHEGATSYTVEVDGDSDFIGATSYTTKTTSLVVPDPLGAG